MICGYYGLVLLLTEVAILAVSIVIVKSTKTCNAYGAQATLYVEVFFWGFIGIVIGGFMIVKLVFLFLAWTQSRLYLRMHNIL